MSATGQIQHTSNGMKVKGGQSKVVCDMDTPIAGRRGSSETGHEEDFQSPLLNQISWDPRPLPPQFSNEGLPRRMQRILERLLTLFPERKVIADVHKHVGFDKCFGGRHRLRDIGKFE